MPIAARIFCTECLSGSLSPCLKTFVKKTTSPFEFLNDSNDPGIRIFTNSGMLYKARIFATSASVKTFGSRWSTPNTRSFGFTIGILCRPVTTVSTSSLRSATDTSALASSIRRPDVDGWASSAPTTSTLEVLPVSVDTSDTSPPSVSSKSAHQALRSSSPMPILHQTLLGYDYSLIWCLTSTNKSNATLNDMLESNPYPRAQELPFIYAHLCSYEFLLVHTCS
ncbi:unnamed protein product [Prunus armeniaca]